MNKDFYKCYVKAKEDPETGYMNRLKEYSEEIHPELSYFSSKNLRDHVSSIIKRNVIMENRSFNIENRTIETNTEVNNYNNIITNADENCSASSNNNNCDNDIDNGNNRDNIKRDAHYYNYNYNYYY